MQHSSRKAKCAHSGLLVQSSDGITVPESLAASVSELPHHPFQPSTSGFDAVEFLLAAGPAEPLRPLASVASGGESSRIMLALKAAPAAAIESAAWRHSGTSAGDLPLWNWGHCTGLSRKWGRLANTLGEDRHDMGPCIEILSAWSDPRV